MQLENASDNYDILSVAPLQIKPGIIANIDEQIALAREGKPCGLFFKTNSVTDKDIIVKIAEASQAGVPVTLLVRGISCLVPGVPGYTDNVRVVSIVGRLLEHSRIYGFGPRENIKIYLSSADLMTRNMEKRVEIAWPILDEGLRNQVLDYIATCLRDTAKLRELKADGTYTKLGELAKPDEPKFESQDFLIKEAQRARAAAAEAKAARNANSRKLMNEQRQAQMAEAEAKVEAVAKAEAAAAEAAREAEAAHKAALEAEAAAKAAEAETAAKPAAKPQPAPKPQAAPKPAEAAAQPVPVKAQVINEPMQAPSHSGIQRRPEKPSLLARVLAKFIR